MALSPGVVCSAFDVESTFPNFSHWVLRVFVPGSHTSVIIPNFYQIAQSRRGSPDVRFPITRLLLHELVSSLSHTNISAYQRTLYAAMFLIAFYGFFRVGEIAAKTKGSMRSVLQLANYNFYPTLRSHAQ